MLYFPGEWQDKITRLVTSMNAKLNDQGRQLRSVVDFLAQRDGQENSVPGSSQISSASLRARLPCHSKHALRALDNDLANDDFLFRDLVRYSSQDMTCV